MKTNKKLLVSIPYNIQKDLDKLKEMMGLSYNTIVNLSLMDYIKKQKDEK